MSTRTSTKTQASIATTTTTGDRYAVRVIDPGTEGCPPIYAVDDRVEGCGVYYTRYDWIAVALCRDLNAGLCGPPASPFGGSLPEMPRPAAEAVAAWEPPSGDDEADMAPGGDDLPARDDSDIDPLLGTEVIIPGLDRIGLAPDEWDVDDRITTGPLAEPANQLALELAAHEAADLAIGWAADPGWPEHAPATPPMPERFPPDPGAEAAVWADLRDPELDGPGGEGPDDAPHRPVDPLALGILTVCLVVGVGAWALGLVLVRVVLAGVLGR